MKTDFPCGIENCRHPHEGEAIRSDRLTRPIMALVLAAAFPVGTSAHAQDAQPPRPAAQPPAPAPTAPSLAPSMTGPLQSNSSPLHVDGGPLGPVYVSGVISGLGLIQNHPMPGDHKSLVDLSNGMAIVQTVQGPLQFYAQIGGYSISTLGTPYFRARRYVNDTYGLVPVAYLKVVPNADFNLQIGKLYTLQGA